MDLTRSYETAIPAKIRERYDFSETRNAASVLASTNPKAFDEVLDVLRTFELEAEDITAPGGGPRQTEERGCSCMSAKPPLCVCHGEAMR